MKNLKILKILVLSLVMFSLPSCDNEPLEGEFSDGTANNGGNGGAANCIEATNNVTAATEAYSQITVADANYTTVCTNYANALQDFISLCGDNSGIIQALIDSLDCSANTPDDCPAAQTATQSAATAYNANTTSSSLCNAYVTALQNEIALCGDTNGSLQAIIDGLDCSTNNTESDYWPRAIGNSWSYNTFQSGPQTYTISSIETVDGFEYYAFEDLFGAQSWLRKNNSNYYVRSVFTGPLQGYIFTSTPITVIMLKDNGIVGESWQSDVAYTISYVPQTPGLPDIPDIDVTANYAFEIIEREIMHTVEGVSYDNVIHVELTVTGSGQVSTVQYYYALDVGIIDYVTDVGSNTLYDYNIN